MKKIENKLSEKLSLGIIEFYGIKEVKSENIFYNYIEEELNILKNADFPHSNFKMMRKLYKSFKIDPTKYRPSSEALWRRLKKKGDFPKINPKVDLLNLLSLKYQISCGLYDIDKIRGDITISIGDREDFYRGIRKERINLNGKILVKDEIGPFGNPSSDSLRTSVDEQSENIMILLFSTRDYALGEDFKNIVNCFIQVYEKLFEINSIKVNII